MQPKENRGTLSAHETCTRFIAAVMADYPHLRNVRYRRIAYAHPRYTFRARFGVRRLYANGYNADRVIRRFTEAIASL